MNIYYYKIDYKYGEHERDTIRSRNHRPQNPRLRYSYLYSSRIVYQTCWFVSFIVIEKFSISKILEIVEYNIYICYVVLIILI